MDTLLLVSILIAVFFLVLRSAIVRNGANLKQLQDEIRQLRAEIKDLTFNLESKRTSRKSEEQSAEPVSSPIAPPATVVQQPPPEPKPVADAIKRETAIPKPEPARKEPLSALAMQASQSPLESASHETVESRRSGFSKWLSDNPDLEKFIGENLVNKIGIAILVLGIAFFVKYAIDQEWINKVGRVCIGLLCGALLIGIAHRLRKNFHSFSSVLVGGGIAVFYFTIAFAFHQYQLISQTASFLLMVLITVFAVILSVLYNRIELAIIACVGGFITPFLVSTGQANYLVLFSYLAILNAGLIVLAYYKRWRALNFIAFFFTEAIYMAWIIQRSGGPQFPYEGTFLFGCLFYAMFVVMNIVHHVSRNSRLKAFDFIILLSVNLFFYSAGLYLLKDWGYGIYNGLFTASLGIINLVLAYLFFRRSRADKNFIYLLIGITLSFISLTAPVQLKGNYITLFWSTEMLVLLWLYQKTFIRLIKFSAVLLTILAILSLLLNWLNLYTGTAVIYPVIFNKGFITAAYTASALYIGFILLRKEADTYFWDPFTNEQARIFYKYASITLGFAAGIIEIDNQFRARMPGTGLEFVYLQLFCIVFSVLLFLANRKSKEPWSPVFFLVYPLCIFMLYLINLANIYESETHLLVSGRFKTYFCAQWFGMFVLFWLAFQSIQQLRKGLVVMGGLIHFYTWFMALSLITVLSIEIFHAAIWLNYSRPESIYATGRVYSKAGLTVLWGLSAFVMIWRGLANRFKTLRIIALVVFALTLLKLFAYDIQDIGPAGKIIAFILLGVLLLIISFMYQRLKKIIIDADAPK